MTAQNRSETKALSAIYLRPAAFPELPSDVSKDLERRGCQIPQQAYAHEHTNVIRGEFARAGQTDWAVLCSVRGTSRILVYWNGKGQNPAEIAPSKDSAFSNKDAAGKVQFLRGISAVNKEFILTHYQAYGGPTPPPIDHEGIDDAFLEKASIVWYFYREAWLPLSGAD
jgi:hypothetical protein